jgi:hypothetical protein
MGEWRYGFERIGNNHLSILFSAQVIGFTPFPFTIGNFTLRCTLYRIWMALSVSLWRLGSGLVDRGITGLTDSAAHSLNEHQRVLPQGKNAGA